MVEYMKLLIFHHGFRKAEPTVDVDNVKGFNCSANIY